MVKFWVNDRMWWVKNMCPVIDLGRYWMLMNPMIMWSPSVFYVICIQNPKFFHYYLVSSFLELFVDFYFSASSWTWRHWYLVHLFDVSLLPEFIFMSGLPSVPWWVVEYFQFIEFGVCLWGVGLSIVEFGEFLLGDIMGGMFVWGFVVSGGRLVLI